MRRTIITSIQLIIAITAFAQNNARQEATLTDAQKIYGLSKFCTEVKYNFAYYDKLTFDWDSLCLASIPAILATDSPLEYWKEMKRISARLGDGHTSVWFSYAPTNDDLISPLPMTTRMYDKRIFVHQMFSKELKEKGLKKGVEILTINGQNAYEYAEQHVKPYVSSSTPQWLTYTTFCSFELTKGQKKDLITLEYKDEKGKTQKLAIDRRTTRWDDEADRETFIYKELPGNIGLLKITTFMDHSSNEKFDKLYEEIKNSEALVIDLRDNSGGNSNYADYILRHFSEKPFKSSQWSSPMYIAAHGSWNYPREWYTMSSQNLYPVKKDIYTKPVILLINAGTYSSAEDFTIKFRGMNRGKIIGQPTGGSTGNPINITLVDGIISAGICTKKDIGPDGTEFVGVGIFPDIEVAESMDDYLNNRDVVLDKAIATISATR